MPKALKSCPRPINCPIWSHCLVGTRTITRLRHSMTKLPKWRNEWAKKPFEFAETFAQMTIPHFEAKNNICIKVDFKTWAIPGLFFYLFSSFQYSWQKSNVQFRFCRWLPLVSKATAHPTQPQPLYSKSRFISVAYLINNLRS